MRTRQYALVAGVALLGLQCLSAEGREQGIAIQDRLGEADVTLAGDTVETKVIVFTNAQGKKCFLPSLSVKVTDIIMGTGVKVGETIRIVHRVCYPTAALAEMAIAGANGTRAVWLLRRSGTGTDFVEMYAMSPAQAEHWQDTVKAFQEKAREFHRFSPLRMSLSIQPGVLVGSLPAQAEMSLLAEGKEAEVPSIAAIRIITAPFSNEPACVTSNVVPESQAGKARPEVVILNVRGLPVSVEAVTFKPTAPVTVRALVRTVGLAAGDPAGELTCSAELLDRHGRTIARSAPVRVMATVPKLSESDEKALAAITEGRFWPVMGPHESLLSAEQVSGMKALLKEYGTTVIAPAIRCGLAFGRESGIDRAERIAMLEELTRVAYFGFADECANELRRLVQEKRQKEARPQDGGPAAGGS